jgi:NADH:ubiquinone oxidoreductase subunit 2 (subunit N)
MILINHGFAVSAVSGNKSKISSSSVQNMNNANSQQKLIAFTSLWWTLIIWALFVVSGFVFTIVGVLLDHRKQQQFFTKVWGDIKTSWGGILICIVIALGYGLFPSICHFFWSKCFLKNNHKQAKRWFIAFWVLVGIAIALILCLWVVVFVFANKPN